MFIYLFIYVFIYLPITIMWTKYILQEKKIFCKKINLIAITFILFFSTWLFQDNI